MFWLFLVAGLLLFSIVTIPPGARRARALRSDVDQAQRIVGQLEQVNETLTLRERALQSDPFYNELVLRSRMKYTKPGEKEVQTTVPGSRIALADTPQVDNFTPSPAAEPGLAAQVTNWALLAASAMMVAAAFILFDRPATPQRAHA
jgi:hypothetical protein